MNESEHHNPFTQPATAGGHNLQPRRGWPPSPLNPLNLLNPLNPGRLRRPLFPCHHRHCQDDEGHAHELPETEGEVEDEEGEDDGGQRFDGGNDAGLRGKDVSHAAQVENEGADGAEEDYIGKGKKHRHVHGTGERSEGHHGQQDKGGQKHAPAHHQGCSVFLNDAYRFHRIEGTGQCREEAPEKGFP